MKILLKFAGGSTMSKLSSLYNKFRRHNKLLKLSLLIVPATVMAVCIIVSSHPGKAGSGLYENLVRLHVVANSDSPEDQQLKRQVRHAVINEMKLMLKDAKDINQAKDVISNYLDRIKEIAREEVVRTGKDYAVNAMLGSFKFPTKAYGDITLPAGNYQALRIVLGEGNGENWWCVLFPPLCFVDATNGTVPDSLKQDLKAVLSTEDYEIITSMGQDEDIPIKIKFKIVELFQNSKSKVVDRLSKLFR